MLISILVVGSAATATVHQFGAAPSEPDVVVTDSYFSPDYGLMKVLGLCDVLRPSIQCWDAMGRPNTDLAKQVTYLFSQAQAGSSSNVPIFSFRFRHKNRLAIIQMPRDGGSQGATQFSNISVPGMPYVYSVFSAPNQANPAINYFDIGADQAANSIDITARLNVQTHRPLEVPCKEGASSDLDSNRVTIGSIKRTSRPLYDMRSSYMYSWGANNQNWQVLLKIAGDSPVSREEINVQPIDSHGRVILNVDPSGKPVTLPKPGTVDAATFAFSASRNIYYSIPVGPFQSTLGGRIWTTTVDPKYISALQCSFWKGRYILFKDFPLNPKN